jgi:hypothetical protein
MAFQILAAVLALLAGVGAVTIVYLALLAFKEVIAWFQSPEVKQIAEADAENIGFTLKKELDSGNYEVVQGVFNRRTNQLHRETVKQYQAENLDAELQSVHRGKALAVYQ